jgi:ribosomal protein S18 acetylase RimI-like enzyme
MSTLVEIRLADDADIPAMAAIRVSEWQTDAFWLDRITHYLRGEHHPQHALPERASFVAVVDGRVVGFVAGHRTRRFGCDGELQWINVHPEHRGKGIAERLTRAMLDSFYRGNAFRICVNVQPDNTPARSLYTKHGAAILNEHWMLWSDLRQMRLPSGDNA